MAVVPVGALGLEGALIPTAGSWQREGDDARFTPRFAAVPGTAYAVVGRRDAREAWLERAQVLVPLLPLVPSTAVASINPGGDQVPANLLRFSVTFSAVMEEGTAAGHIHLLDASGAELPGTLFEMPPELWDRERRRLTVLLEPGRIKRGLQPNVQAGPPLREGSTVTVVVDHDLRDAAGAELVGGAQRTYLVGAPVRSRVDPALWQVRWPESRTDALVVRFDRPLDRALVLRYVRLVDRHGHGHGHPVPGDTSLNREATEWAFTPAEGSGPARVDDWALQVDARLEDLAGNSVRGVFD
ncbi:MAG: hypothetical protein JWQ64_1229, partial [Subtercola sp.]|nr:hypothetical protein [Subtercola sp.]